jgi:hypothetical protein
VVVSELFEQVWVEADTHADYVSRMMTIGNGLW